LDFFLVAMPYTLVDEAILASEFSLCEQRGVGVVRGCTYASGILATGPTPDARYNYEPATSHIRDRTERIERLCRDFGVPLKAAALQFPLLRPSLRASSRGRERRTGPRKLLTTVENPASRDG
jgi:D-threo-aldose 1-dehydrogenase